MSDEQKGVAMLTTVDEWNLVHANLRTAAADLATATELLRRAGNRIASLELLDPIADEGDSSDRAVLNDIGRFLAGRAGT